MSAEQSNQTQLLDLLSKLAIKPRASSPTRSVISDVSSDDEVDLTHAKMQRENAMKIKKWVEIDDELKRVERKIMKYKKKIAPYESEKRELMRRKRLIDKSVVDVMKAHGYNVLPLGNTKIGCVEQKRREPLNQASIKRIMTKYSGDAKTAQQIAEYITSEQTEKIQYNLVEFNDVSELKKKTKLAQFDRLSGAKNK